MGPRIAYCAVKAGTDVMVKSLGRALGAGGTGDGRLARAWWQRGSCRGEGEEFNAKTAVHYAFEAGRHRGGCRIGRARLRHASAVLHGDDDRRGRRAVTMKPQHCFHPSLEGGAGGGVAPRKARGSGFDRLGATIRAAAYPSPNPSLKGRGIAFDCLRVRSMRAVRLRAKAANLDALAPALETFDLAAPPAGMALVEIAAAAVNPSDVKAALGLMPYAVFPRTHRARLTPAR